MIVVLLAACGDDPSKVSEPLEPSDSDAPDTETTDTHVDTPTDTGLDTLPVPPLCVVEQDITSGALWGGWVSPGGTLYATGTSPSPRMRAPDGTWTVDAMNLDDYWETNLVSGSDDGEVWAVSRDDARRREADGTWTAMGAPTSRVYDLHGIHVFGPGDVLALRVDERDCVDCPVVQTPVLLWWDGVGWTEETMTEVRGQIEGMTVLPDRTVVLAADWGLRTIGPGGAEIPTPPELFVTRVTSAPDGTLVAVGGEGVAIGTLAGGLTLHDPGVAAGWSDAWAASATDIWVSGEFWELGVIPHGVIAHWDGVGWTTVIADWPGETFRLAGGDGRVFALGGYSHELVLVGDAGGLALERELWRPSDIKQLAVDDVTGSAWSIGYARVFGWFEEGAWTGVPFPGELDAASYHFAVSDGRIVLYQDDELWIVEGGSVARTATDLFFFDLAAADGVLFAAGQPRTGYPGLDVWMEAGAGWVQLDLAGLPADADPSALWAGRADDLWLGFETGDRGALAHWDGTSFTVVADDLRTKPSWIRRMSDGEVYFDLPPAEVGRGPDPVWVYDGNTVAPVPDMPSDVRAAHRLSDGTWFVSVMATRPDDLYGQLLRRDPGAAEWVEIFESDGEIQLAGLDNTIWAERGPLSWTQAPCDP